MTLAAGIDVGALWTKAVVLDGGELAGWAALPTRDQGAAEAALAEALTPRNAAPGDLAAVVATGAGRGEVPFPTRQATEVVCAARAARLLDPVARVVIDMGGEGTRVVKLDEAGQVADFALNEKCAAGTGVFLDAMAKVMRVPLEEMGPLSLESRVNLSINSTCVVFAESEVVSQVHRRTPTRDILRGIHLAIASRVHSLASRVHPEGEILVVGGLARNVGLVACLEELIGRKARVPERPHLAPALGAALLAAEGAP